jgi:Aspartyl protease
MPWARRQIMKRHWSADFAALMGLFICLPPIARAQVKTVQIPFSNSGGLMVVEAKINGKSASLLFDSGAMRTFVKPSILDGLKETSGKAVSLADGNVVEVRVVKTAVSFGDASVEVPVGSYDMTRFSDEIGIRIDGVVGQDVIGKFSGVLIDYVRHRITLIE